MPGPPSTVAGGEEVAGGEGVAGGTEQGPVLYFSFSLMDVTVDVWLLVQIYGSICGTYTIYRSTQW